MLVWEMGASVLVPALLQSVAGYYATASDYSQNLQVIFFVALFLIFILLTLIPFQRYCVALCGGPGVERWLVGWWAGGCSQ